jgi:hypothetical protein
MHGTKIKKNKEEFFAYDKMHTGKACTSKHSCNQIMHYRNGHRITNIHQGFGLFYSWKLL